MPDIPIHNAIDLNGNEIKNAIIAARERHGWLLSDEIKVASGQTDLIQGIAVDVPTGYTCKIVKAWYGLASGTSFNFKFTIDGVDATNWTSITVNSAKSSTTADSQAITDGQVLRVEINSVAGTPTNGFVTAILQYSKAA